MMSDGLLFLNHNSVEIALPYPKCGELGRRTFVYLEGQKDPLVASCAEDTIVRDLVQEPREVIQSANSKRF